MLRTYPRIFKPLARRHAYELSDTRWDYDQDQLIKLLKKSREIERESKGNMFSSNKHLKSILFILGFAALAAGLYLFTGQHWMELKPKERSIATTLSDVVDLSGAEKLDQKRIRVDNRLPDKTILSLGLASGDPKIPSSNILEASIAPNGWGYTKPVDLNGTCNHDIMVKATGDRTMDTRLPSFLKINPELAKAIPVLYKSMNLCDQLIIDHY